MKHYYNYFIMTFMWTKRKHVQFGVLPKKCIRHRVKWNYC